MNGRLHPEGCCVAVGELDTYLCVPSGKGLDQLSFRVPIGKRIPLDSPTEETKLEHGAAVDRGWQG